VLTGEMSVNHELQMTNNKSVIPTL